jgi:hypothetical protein
MKELAAHTSTRTFLGKTIFVLKQAKEYEFVFNRVTNVQHVFLPSMLPHPINHVIGSQYRNQSKC